MTRIVLLTITLFSLSRVFGKFIEPSKNTSGSFLIRGEETNKYVQVTISEGTIRGHVRFNSFNGKNYYSFEGIPYAKSPIGRLRFKPPEPIDSWEGVLDTLDSNINCPQGNKLPNETEDCLIANVYAPEEPSDTKRAVFVYVYGGGFVEGSVAWEEYRPDYLLAHDVIAVTFNYRLGLLGFLKLEDPKLGIYGNNGMRDAILMLRWIQRNIENFGGNTNQVVLVGCSCGSAAVHALTLSPMAKGLFHGAIMESGNFLHIMQQVPALQVAQAHNRSILTEEEAFALFNSSDSKTLDEMITRIKFRGFEVTGVEIEEPSSPDPFMPKCATEIIENKEYNDVPILVGYNSMEGIEYRPFADVKNFFEKISRTLVQGVIWGVCDGNTTDAVKSIEDYYQSSIHMKHHPKVIRFCYQLGDHLFLIPFVDVIDLHFRKVKSPVYVYRFDLDTKLNFIKNREKIYDVAGASHADEVAYIFKKKVTPHWERGNSKEEIGLNNFQTIWTNFIKTSNPNLPNNDLFTENYGNDKFLPLDKDSDSIRLLNINQKLKMMEDLPERNRVEFWKELRSKSEYQCCRTYWRDY